MKTSLGLLLLASVATADDWPCWRGPARNGISAETAWNDTWTAPKVAWKADVGIGFSSFSVAAGRVFTAGFADDQDSIFCFDLDTGKKLWSHAYASELGDKYFDGGTTGTPVVDGDRVYFLGRWGDAFCFEAASGKIVWATQVQKATRIRIPDWGYSGSILVQGELLILPVGESGLALEKNSGKILWQSSDKDAGYSTPLPFTFKGAELILMSSGAAWLAVDPKTGKEAWRVPWVTSYGVNAADPIVDGPRLFVSSGYGKGCGLFALGGAAPSQVWVNKALAVQMAPPVLLDGHVYGIDGNTGKPTKLKCLELATGAEKWAFDGVGAGALTAAAGKLIVLTEKGELLVGAATPSGFTPTSRAKVLDGKCWTPPVLSNGRVLCRAAAGDVVCLDLRK